MKFLTLTDGENIALKTIVACVAFFLLVLTACVCMLATVKVDAAFLWPIIIIIGAFAGINAATFAQFRTSDYGFIDHKGEADAKVAEATKAVPSPISVAAPSTVVAPPATDITNGGSRG